MRKRLTAVAVLATLAFAGAGASAAAAAPSAIRPQTMAAAQQFCLYELNSGVISINIRSGPGTAYPVVGYWTSGQRRYVGVTSGSWRQLDSGYWASASYTHKVSPPVCYL